MADIGIDIKNNNFLEKILMNGKSVVSEKNVHTEDRIISKDSDLDCIPKEISLLANNNEKMLSPTLCKNEDKQSNEVKEPPNKKPRLESNINQSPADLISEIKVNELSLKEQDTTSVPKQFQSPKKKLQLTSQSKKPEKKLFIYGNYNRYYGYRCINNFTDVRIDVFKTHRELFENKEVLDIGCNSGLLTCNVAEHFNVKYITGIDIDRKLIDLAKKFIRTSRQKTPPDSDRTKYPFNISFVHGNYVLRNDVLLEIEREQFDLILCLSVTKWVQLNFGDNGLKQAFKRMFLQLRNGGKLILEAQPWPGYKRRKKLTPEIAKNYDQIKFFPANFADYLISSEIGFNSYENLSVPEHSAKGFCRPIQVFYKKQEISVKN